MKTQSRYNGWEKTVFKVSQGMNQAACAVLFGLMVLTMADVFGRKVFSNSILGTVELSEFALVILVFFSLAATEFADGHVKVELVMNYFGKRTGAIVDMVTQLICFVISLIFTASTFLYAGRIRASGDVSQDLWLPKYPFIYLVMLGFAVLSLAVLIKFVLACKKAVKP